MQADWPDRSQAPDLKKLLVDFLGVFRGISSPKILVAFAKMSYPSLQHLLNTFMGGLLNDGLFVASLLGGLTRVLHVPGGGDQRQVLGAPG